MHDEPMNPDKPLPPLSEEEQATYAWQTSIPDFGEIGQRRLKAATVLVSRVGGVGGAAAVYLAAAGVGRLILAHRGNLKPSDLNRQVLMTHDWLCKPRVACAARRLRELNPRLEVLEVAENVTEANAARLVAQADAVVSCAPLFQERLLMNRWAVAHRRPLVDCAMYELQAQITCVTPGGPCLSCLYPEFPEAWQRRFPVFGAVAGMIGSMGAMEAIKLLGGFGESLAGQILLLDLRRIGLRRLKATRRADCPVCGPEK